MEGKSLRRNKKKKNTWAWASSSSSLSLRYTQGRVEAEQKEKGKKRLLRRRSTETSYWLKNLLRSTHRANEEERKKNCTRRGRAWNGVVKPAECFFVCLREWYKKWHTMRICRTFPLFSHRRPYSCCCCSTCTPKWRRAGEKKNIKKLRSVEKKCGKCPSTLDEASSAQWTFSETHREWNQQMINK